jgi:hypothetical protein
MMAADYSFPIPASRAVNANARYRTCRSDPVVTKERIAPPYASSCDKVVEEALAGGKRLPFVFRCLAIQPRKRIGSVIYKLCTIGEIPGS